jgi:hypothetical protein
MSDEGAGSPIAQSFGGRRGPLHGSQTPRPRVRKNPGAPDQLKIKPYTQSFRARRGPVHGSETARPGWLITPGAQYQLMISPYRQLLLPGWNRVRCEAISRPPRT